MPHVHITSNGKIVGTLTIDETGRVIDDGTAAAINAIDHTNHGSSRLDGQRALDAVVDHLDRATLVGAVRCEDDCGI